MAGFHHVTKDWNILWTGLVKSNKIKKLN
jgi:tubulin polyglutamylase TTLL4